LTLCVSGVLLAWSMVQLGLFAVLPVAYSTLFRSMTDGCIVFDADGCIAEMNASAQSLLGEGQACRGAAVSALETGLPGIGGLLSGAVFTPA